MASLRSSKRETPRKKYTVDAFDGIQDLIQYSSSSEDGGEDQPEQVDEDEEDDEDEFRAEAVPSEPEDDTMSGLDGPAEEVDDRASDAGEADLDGSMSIIQDITTTPGGTAKRRRGRKAVAPGEALTYTRGVPGDLHHNLNKQERWRWMFGPTKEDQMPVMKARDRWTHQSGLPSRKKNDRIDRGGFGYNGAYRNEAKSAESNWSWYGQNGGREAFKRRQIVKNLTVTEAQEYLPTDFELRIFVMGPVEKRKMFSMKVRQFISMSAAFGPKKESSTPSSSGKKGFILNLGARIQSLDWAPSQNGTKHHLAVTVLPLHRLHKPPAESLGAPAFTPQPLYRSSIQIWEFSADNNNYIDDAVPPQLSTVVCAEIGEIRSIKWCPVPHKQAGKLGLLGCVSGDGVLRIIDVDRPANDSRANNMLLEKAAFECKPPNTVCTSFTWISSSRIAAACANGFVAVWDVEKVLQSDKESPRPDIYTDISTTHIVSVTSCYPSFPHMIVTTSMNGFMALTDLRQPRPSSRSATGLSSRTRIGQPFFAWLDFAHSGVSVEENQTVRCYPFRRFFTGLAVGKLKGHVTSMAVSPCHPYVLIGSAAGEVTGHNPIRRLVDGGKSPLFQQRWFTHEWRRPDEDEMDAADEAESEEGEESPSGTNIHAVIGRDGLSRITDGFKVQPPRLNAGSHNAKDGPVFSTVYEVLSAVTALAWNPNEHVGGWAAAGMADGLLKVEDVAI